MVLISAILELVGRIEDLEAITDGKWGSNISSPFQKD